MSSIRLYASHLNDFLSQVAVDGSSVDAISDNWLTAYKRALTKRENSSGIRNSENYASQVLRTVIHYLYWLEENKYIRGVVGENKRNKVRIKKTPRGIRHPLSNERKPTQKQSVTPRGEWIAAVKAYGPMREDLAIRFELMIDWGRSAGLRAKEICYLKVNQMPLRKTAERALVEGRNVYVDLRITKGGKPAKIPVSPLLIQKTWDYIDIFRVDVVSFFSQKAKRKYEVYEDPGLIFLSSKTGRSISPRSFSNSIRKAFLSAVEDGELTIDERVWTHGLRHNFTANLLKGLDSNGVKRPEAIARQVTRHGSENAMEPYLTDRFNEDFDG